MSEKKKICVFCASNSNTPEEWINSAREVGKRIGEKGLDLVFGGCHMASMGAVARGAQEGGGKVIGVIPQHFIDRGFCYESLDEKFVVNDLRERKKIMEDLADAFVVLPGGFGTLDELFDVLEVQVIRLRQKSKTKPIAILNTGGFFDELQAFTEKIYTHKLAYEECRIIYRFLNSPEELMQYLLSVV